jgi:signal transduction histidine kinase
VSVLLTKTLRSSTFRLALISIAVFGAVVIALFAYVYWSTTAFVMGRSDGALGEELANLNRAYDTGGRESLIRAIQQRVSDGRPGAGLYLLADASFASIAGNLEKWPPALQERQGWSEVSSEALKPQGVGKSSLFRVKVKAFPDETYLLVGKNIDDLGRFANRIYVAFALAILLIIVLAAVASVSVTRRTVGRIETINATTRSIMESGLGRRISLRGTQDEWDHLAHNLNSMLDRIDSLLGEVKQVSDNVAHDLRTPLTRMRGRLEKACILQRDPERDQSLLADTIADLDDVLRMFSSLTRISQIETANVFSTFRKVNLCEVATQVAELFDAAAEDQGGRVEIVGNQAVRILADRDLIFDALSNLVDNAIKHGRDGGRVVVRVNQGEGGAFIAVSDDGPGIPSGEVEHVFKRFYRLERSRHTLGNGLGLSLVAAVARLHNARIALSDNKPGLTIGMHFPSTHAASHKGEGVSPAAAIGSLLPSDGRTIVD